MSVETYNPQDQTTTVEVEDPKVVPKPGEGDLEVQVESDPLYKKPDWKTDPAKNLDDPTDKDYSERVQKRISRLRASLSEAAKQRDKASLERDETVRLAQAYQRKTQELERQLASGTAMYIERQADTEDANSKVAEQALKAALIAGDPDAITKAQSDLATARAKATQYRGAAEYRKSTVPPPVQAQQQETRQPVDEQLTRWQNDNPWFQTDQEMTDAAFEIHDELESKGVRIGSPAYYKSLDQQMHSKFADYFGEEDKTVAPASQPKPAAVTPPAQRQSLSSQANPQKPGPIKLTQSQVATATRLGLTAQQYAKELVRLRSEGVAV